MHIIKTMSKTLLHFLESMRPVKPETSLGFASYPSRRGHPLHTAENYLQSKRDGDGAEDLWRVHDGLYDFSEFIEDHPGGRDWLELTKGTDITEAFECHHISLVPEKLLGKYFIRNATGPRNSPFVFEEDGFYRTLKKNIREALETTPEEPAHWSKAYADVLFTSYIILASTSAYFNSVTFAIIAGMSLTLTTIAAHNFFHQRDNFRMFYFDFAFLSSRSWRVTHALSHHLFTNTVYDMEVEFVEPWFQYLPVKKHFFWKYVSWIYSPVLYLLAFHMNLLQTMLQAISDKGRSLQKTYLLPFTVLLLMFAISPESPLRVFLLFNLIMFSASVHFTAVGLNAAHHHPDIFHDGDAPRKRVGLDWGLHEIDAVMDRSDINWSHFLVLTNFGDHCMHHLFPTIDHGRLKYLHPVFESTCEKFNVPIKVTTQMGLVVGQYMQIAKEEPKPVFE